MKKLFKKLDYTFIINSIEPYTRKTQNIEMLSDIKNYVTSTNKIINTLSVYLSNKYITNNQNRKKAFNTFQKMAWVLLDSILNHYVIYLQYSKNLNYLIKKSVYSVDLDLKDYSNTIMHYKDLKYFSRSSLAAINETSRQLFLFYIHERFS